MNQLNLFTEEVLLGFTGTRHGMSEAQFRETNNLTLKLNPTQGHHGMCVGSDTQFHAILRALTYHCYIVGHPPTKQDAMFVPSECDELWDAKDYLERDKDIVVATNIMIATPYEMQEKKRSGTWFTIRHARKLKRPLYIIYRDGSIETENLTFPKS